MNHSRRPRLGIETLEDRSLPSTAYALAAGNTILRFDTFSPQTIQASGTVTGLGTNQTLVGIDFRPRTGQLIGTAVTTGSARESAVTTYKIDPFTLRATLSNFGIPIGTIVPTLPGAADVPSGYDFDPTTDRVRIVNVNGENARLNPTTNGLTGDDTNLTYQPGGTPQIIAIAYDRNFDRQTVAGSGDTFGGSNLIADGIPTTLYGIDRATSSLVSLSGTADSRQTPNGGLITVIGSLGVTLSQTADAGFDIATTDSPLTRIALFPLLPITATEYAALTTADGVTSLYVISTTTGSTLPLGQIGDGATEIRSLAILPDTAIVAGSGPGSESNVNFFGRETGQVRRSFLAFPGFLGGVRVATGDITGDGIADVVAAAGPGGGPHVKVFDGSTGAEIRSFFAYSPGFRGGVNVAIGDLNGDGFDELITAPDNSGGAHVKVFSGISLFNRMPDAELFSFFAYDAGLRHGAGVAAGDTDGDGRAEIITSNGASTGTGHVKVFSGATGAEIRSFFPYASNFLGGISLAVGDLNGDGLAEIVTAPASGGATHVKIFNNSDFAETRSFFSHPLDYRGGVRIALADTTGDGLLDILISGGDGTLLVRDGVNLLSQAPIRAFTTATAAFVSGYRQ